MLLPFRQGVNPSILLVLLLAGLDPVFPSRTGLSTAFLPTKYPILPMVCVRAMPLGWQPGKSRSRACGPVREFVAGGWSF
jgi:hypothetical protein